MSVGVPTQFDVIPGRFYTVLTHFVNLNGIAAAADVITNFKPGFPGSIVKWYFTTGTVASTGGKSATLNLEVNAVNLSGGTIALTTVSCNTVGKVTASAAITGGNTFDADDTISVEASSVTQFSQGNGFLTIVLAGKTKGGGLYTGASQFQQAQNRFRGAWCFLLDLNSITGAGDVFTQWTPGFPGRIVKMDFITGTVPASTASKAATLNVEIGSANCVGGTVALTTVGCDTNGEIVEGSVFSGANGFSATDTLSVEAASVTQFTQGHGTLVIQYEGVVQSAQGPSPQNMPRNRYHASYCIPFTMVTIAADGDLVTDITPGFPFNVRKTYWVQGKPVTTPGGAADLNVEKGAVNLSGGVASLTAATCTPLGTVIAGTAVTAGQEFDSDDTLAVETSSTTGFTEGEGTLVLELEGKVM